jgi:AcrR family transcriptional regulator
MIPSHEPEPRLDPRARRTRDRLGDALVELVQEKPFDSITVQDVLDRAGVSRSTFYVHYRDKHDLFLSDVDEFLDMAANMLTQAGDRSDRVAGVREFFAHVGSNRPLYSALVTAGRIADFMELAQGHFARGIERRLAASPRAAAAAPETRALMAHGFAAAMLSMLTWWMERGSATSPEQVDALFHDMVWNGVEARAPRAVPR